MDANKMNEVANAAGQGYGFEWQVEDEGVTSVKAGYSLYVALSGEAEGEWRWQIEYADTTGPNRGVEVATGTAVALDWAIRDAQDALLELIKFEGPNDAQYGEGR